jgi:hypothetical protein
VHLTFAYAETLYPQHDHLIHSKWVNIDAQHEGDDMRTAVISNTQRRTRKTAFHIFVNRDPQRTVKLFLDLKIHRSRDR